MGCHTVQPDTGNPDMRSDVIQNFLSRPLFRPWKKIAVSYLFSVESCAFEISLLLGFNSYPNIVKTFSRALKYKDNWKSVKKKYDSLAIDWQSHLVYHVYNGNPGNTLYNWRNNRSINFVHCSSIVLFINEQRWSYFTRTCSNRKDIGQYLIKKSDLEFTIFPTMFLPPFLPRPPRRRILLYTFGKTCRLCRMNTNAPRLNRHRASVIFMTTSCGYSPVRVSTFVSSNVKKKKDKRNESS